MLGGAINVAGVQVSIAPGGGYWITLGGLVLVTAGVFFSGSLARALERWTQILAQLREG